MLTGNSNKKHTKSHSLKSKKKGSRSMRINTAGELGARKISTPNINFKSLRTEIEYDVIFERPQILSAFSDNEKLAKLKNLSILMNTPEFKALRPSEKSAFSELFNYAQTLLSTIHLLNKEVDRLKKLNKFLYVANSKKSDVIAKTVEENRILKESLSKFEEWENNHIQKIENFKKIRPIQSKVSEQKSKRTSHKPPDFLMKSRVSRTSIRIEEMRKKCIIYDREDIGLFLQNSRVAITLDRNDLLEIVKQNDAFQYLKRLLVHPESFYEKVTQMNKSKIQELFTVMSIAKTEIIRSIEVVYDLLEINRITYSLTSIQSLNELFNFAEFIFNKFFKFEDMKIMLLNHETNTFFDILKAESGEISMDEHSESRKLFLADIKQDTFVITEAEGFHPELSQIFSLREIKSYSALTLKDDRANILGFVFVASELHLLKKPNKRIELLLDSILSVMKEILFRNFRELKYRNILSNVKQITQKLHAIVDGGNFESFLKSISELIKQEFSASAVRIYFIKKQNDASLLSDLSQPVLIFDDETIIERNLCGLVSRSIWEKRVIFTKDPLHDPSFNNLLDISNNLNLASFPIVLDRDEVVGAIQIAADFRIYSKNLGDIILRKFDAISEFLSHRIGNAIIAKDYGRKSTLLGIGQAAGESWISD